MIIISSTGGSGSSFVVDKFRKNGWKVCVRPDGGRQKANRTVYSIWKDRTKPFFKPSLESKNFNDKQLFDETYKKLKNKKVMLMCMSWGGMGFLNSLNEKTIYLVRNPIFAFNSYSGGGWRSEGGKRRIKHIGAIDQNDKKWIDAFLGDFSFWLDGAKNALKAVENGNGTIIRYHNFVNDWKKLGEKIPMIYNKFKCKDNMEKLKKYLSNETINYITNKTCDVWDKIEKYG